MYMADMLQELLGLQDKTSMCTFFFLFSCFGMANALLRGSAAVVSSMAVSSDRSSLRPSELASQVSLLKAKSRLHS